MHVVEAVAVLGEYDAHYRGELISLQLAPEIL